MEKIFLLRAVFLFVSCLAVFTSGYGHGDAQLDYLKRVPRERRQSHDLMESIKRLVRRETIRRHKYHFLSNWQLLHSRRKRGWIGDDPINRATEIPGATSTTPSSPPPPPINPSLLPVTDKIVTIVTLTTTTPTVSTTVSTTMKPVPTTKATVSSTIEITGTSPSTSTTTESSSAPGLIYCCQHISAVIVTTFLLRYMYI